MHAQLDENPTIAREIAGAHGCSTIADGHLRDGHVRIVFEGQLPDLLVVVLLERCSGVGGQSRLNLAARKLETEGQRMCGARARVLELDVYAGAFEGGRA